MEEKIGDKTVHVAEKCLTCEVNYAKRRARAVKASYSLIRKNGA